jgi:hypothetical protein
MIAKRRSEDIPALALALAFLSVILEGDLLFHPASHKSHLNHKCHLDRRRAFAP